VGLSVRALVLSVAKEMEFFDLYILGTNSLSL